jgi:ectoine hydroxylase-related dioxygenase (phytanoyl-CoA dioxygenase family)
MEKTYYTNTAKVIPNQVQLGQLERRLKFHPSTVIDPQALTREQVAAYNQHGYVKQIRIFDDAEMTVHRRFFDDLLARTLAGGGNSYSIISAHMKYGAVYDLLTHPSIVACARDILGKDVIGWGAHYFCKLPHDAKVVSWHQDASFWPLTPSKTVTIWLAIDDADRENACMRFIAGSHRLGHLTYRMSEDAEQSVLNQTVDNPEQFGEVVYDELKAGEISLHSDLLLHGSEANHSSRRRCGLTLRYCAAEVRSDPGFGWHREGVVASGVDPDGHWGNPPRPSSDWDATVSPGL